MSKTANSTNKVIKKGMFEIPLINKIKRPIIEIMQTIRANALKTIANALCLFLYVTYSSESLILVVNTKSNK